MNNASKRAGTTRNSISSKKTVRIKTNSIPACSQIEKCEKCGKTFDKSEMMEIPQKAIGNAKPIIKYYCKDCFEDNFEKCYFCGKIIEKDDANYMDDIDEYVCERCMDDHYESCDRCGDLIKTEDAIYYHNNEGNDVPYCKKCASKYLVKCSDCGDYIKEDDAIYINGDPYCEDCADKFITCDICDKRVNEDDIRPLGKGGEDNVCLDCIKKRKLVQCSICESYFDEKEIDAYAGDVCVYCLNKNLIDAAKVAISTSMVMHRYPGLDKRMTDVFNRSAVNRSIDWKKMANVIKNLVPDVNINFDDFTYTNEAGYKHRLTDLKSAKNSIYKKIRERSSSDAESLVYFIDKLYNSRNDIAKLGGEHVQAREKIIDAIKVRMYNEKQNPGLKKETDALVGKYPYDKITAGDAGTNLQGCEFCFHLEKGKKYHDTCAYATQLYRRAIVVGGWPNARKSCKGYSQTTVKTSIPEITKKLPIKNPSYTFLITKDPVAILAKTTSQCWEHMSCEKIIRGQFGEGAFSDIMWSNLVCFILDPKKLPVARIMIRWCKTESDAIDFGIEKKWYYCADHPDKAEDFSEMGNSTINGSNTRFLGGLTAISATKFLVSILEEKGKFKDYNICKTPYVYKGYSDTAQEGITNIKYHRNIDD